MTAEIIKIDANTRIKVIRYKNGKIKSKTPIVNDKIHGIVEWWYESGTKMWEAAWVAGKHHGKYTDWEDNEQKNWETTWRDGKEHGVETCWNPVGKQKEVYRIHGEKYAQIGWDKEGNVTIANFPRSSIITTRNSRIPQIKKPQQV